MATCKLCEQTSPTISEMLGVCLTCIRARPGEAAAFGEKAHMQSRADFGLPPKPPDDPDGVSCTICVNQCKIPENGTGYCGLRINQKGRLRGVSSTAGKLSWYHDPLPTNCVGDWVCAGGTGAGYPTYAYCPEAESGYKNLAVFFQACSFNCLFCQNWHFREETIQSSVRSHEEILADVDGRTSCICYFGGDPSPQLPYSLKVSRVALDQNKNRILRMELAIDSGGCVKFDLKAWDPKLHLALTGVTNKRTLDNFARAASWIDRRPTPPPLIANSLLVPGYIDEHEIGAIAKFVADLNPNIPYSLLAFHPQFYMSDLPVTSKDLANRCYQTARDAGLNQVRIGNIHLLV
jgi:pyruvate formate lyase activating enzyme